MNADRHFVNCSQELFDYEISGRIVGRNSSFLNENISCFFYLSVIFVIGHFV